MSYFNDKAANRAAKRNASTPFVVSRLTKANRLPKRLDFEFTGCETREQADEMKATLERLNPGCTFVVAKRLCEGKDTECYEVQP